MDRRAIRDASGLTQKQLAKKLKVSVSAIGRFERGINDSPKLTKAYNRLEKQGIRKEFGLTQKQIAGIAGVSQSTVSKFESGGNVIGTEGDKIKQFYKNLTANVETLRENRELFEEAKKRLKVLEDGNLGRTSMAARSIKDKMIKTSGEISNMIFGERPDYVKRYIKNIENFLKSKTSTVEGVEDWLNNVTQASMETSKIKDFVTNDAFWKLYKKFLNSGKIKKLPSKQLQEMISKIFDTKWLYEYGPEELLDNGRYDDLVRDFIEFNNL